MIFNRVGDVVEEGAGFLEARARIILHQFERAGIVTAGYAAAGIVVVAGVLALLAGLTVWVAQELGVAPALTITGGLLLVVAGITLLSLRAWWRRPSKQEQVLIVQAAAAKEAFRKAVRGSDEGASDARRPSLLDQWGGAQGLLQLAMKNPAILAGGLAMATSLFAGSKLLRVLTRIVALTGMASTVAKSVAQVREAMASARSASPDFECNGQASPDLRGSRRDHKVRL